MIVPESRAWNSEKNPKFRILKSEEKKVYLSRYGRYVVEPL